MIHFRYHLVSLIAVFLALAIGVAMGATVIDRALVDALRDQVSAAERRAEDIKRENDTLKDARAQNDRYRTGLALQAISGKLDGLRVQFVATESLSNDTIARALEASGSAGAVVLPVLRVPAQFDEKQLAALESLIGSNDPADLWRTVGIALGGKPADENPTTSAENESPTSEAPALLPELVEAGVLRGELDTASPDADVVVLLTSVDVPWEVETVAAGLVPSLPVVVGEYVPVGATSAEVVRSGSLAGIRGDERRRDKISTLDSLERDDAPTTLVLVIAAAAAGETGQYGFESGARDGLMPRPNG